MRMAEVVFGWIEVLWLAWATAFAWSGIVALTDTVQQTADASAVVVEVLEKRQLIAAVLEEVTQEPAGVVVASTRKDVVALDR